MYVHFTSSRHGSAIHSDSYAAGPRAAFVWSLSRLLLVARARHRARAGMLRLYRYHYSESYQGTRRNYYCRFVGSTISAREQSHSSSHADYVYLLREMRTPALVTPKPLWRHSSGRPQPRIHDDATYRGTSSNTSQCESKTRSGWQALVILNRDIKYGFYSYEDLLPQDSTSMWSIGQVRFLSRTGGLAMECLPIPIQRQSLRWLLR